MKDYLLSVFLPLPAGHTFVLVCRVKVEQSLAWVKAHADEIATRAVADDKVAQKINAGAYVALSVEAAPA
jgi:hypothetical protein